MAFKAVRNTDQIYNNILVHVSLLERTNPFRYIKAIDSPYDFQFIHLLP